jgi:hypothetical protein
MLIDYICEKFTSGTLITDVSDHFPILQCLGTKGVYIFKESLTVIQRKPSYSQLRNMSERLKINHWDSVFRYNT